MDTRIHYLFLSICVLFTPLIHGQDVCVQKSPCVCEFSNGTGIDLRPTTKPTFYSTPVYNTNTNASEYYLSTYMFHPCADVYPPTISSQGTCLKPLSLCRNVITMTKNASTGLFVSDNGKCDFLGSANDSTFTSNGDGIVLFNKPSQTTILLVCAQGDDQLHIVSLDEPKDLLLAFYSRTACVRQIEDLARSLGSTLLIIFFSCVIFYLVLGICTKKFLMGATGIEVIPNLAFWSDLPNLVKDGWAFALNGFKLPARGTGPAVSPDPNSYDSI